MVGPSQRRKKIGQTVSFLHPYPEILEPRETGKWGKQKNEHELPFLSLQHYFLVTPGLAQSSSSVWRTAPLPGWKAWLKHLSPTLAFRPQGCGARSPTAHPEGCIGEVLVPSKHRQMSVAIGKQCVTHSFPPSGK